MAPSTRRQPATVALLLAALVLATVAAVGGAVAAGPMELQYQPQYHVRPRANWINDPNGPFRDPVTGKVHLYMQYNPSGPLWGNMSWYHVSSDDYVSWKLEGVAMRNDASFDSSGVYSGSITQTPLGEMLLMYTCVTPGERQQQCVAVPAAPSTDRQFRSWEKLASNPVMRTVDVPGLGGVDMFRDPTNIWRDPDNSSQWLVAFVARVGGTARVVVFVTDDPTWRGGYRFSHTIYEDPFDFYRMLECPDFFPLQTALGQQYFLKLSTMESHQDYMVYGTYTRAASLEGDGVERTVYVESTDATPHFVDFGPYYAAKQHYDPVTGKTVLWGWTYEEDENANANERGWSGVLNLPRELVYDTVALKLRSPPLSELQGLRNASRSIVVAAQPVGNAASPVLVEPAAGSRQMEIEVEFTVPPAAFVTTDQYTAENAPSFGLLVRHNADRSLFTRVSVTMNPIAMETADGVYAGYDFTDAGDYKRVQMPREVEPAQCAALCDADRRCLSWTLTVPTAAVTSATCSLKRLAGTLSANATCTSGRANKVVLGVDKASSGTTGWSTPHYGPSAVYPHLDGKVTLRVFIDDSIVEVFKDDGLESVSTRVYIPDAAQNGVSLFATNLAADLTASATVHYLNTIWTGDFEEPQPQPDSAASVTATALMALMTCLALLFVAVA